MASLQAHWLAEARPNRVHGVCGRDFLSEEPGSGPPEPTHGQF